MIEDDDIATALGQILETIDPPLPIVWPGKDAPPQSTRPYLIFDFVPVSRRDRTLTGGGDIATGFAMVTIMSEPGLPIWSSTVRNNNGGLVLSCGAIARVIRTLYPYPLYLPIAGGAVTVSQPPEVMQGYPDGPHWRTPVRIPYSAS